MVPALLLNTADLMDYKKMAHELRVARGWMWLTHSDLVASMPTRSYRFDWAIEATMKVFLIALEIRRGKNKTPEKFQRGGVPSLKPTEPAQAWPTPKTSTSSN